MPKTLPSLPQFSSLEEEPPHVACGGAEEGGNVVTVAPACGARHRPGSTAAAHPEKDACRPASRSLQRRPPGGNTRHHHRLSSGRDHLKSASQHLPGRRCHSNSSHHHYHHHHHHHTAPVGGVLAIRAGESGGGVPALLTQPPPLPNRVPLLLAASRDNAVNSAALRALLRSKGGAGRGSDHPSFGGSTLAPDTQRQEGLLRYIHAVTRDVERREIDLSRCALGDTDFVFLRDVIGTLPNVTSIDLSGTALSPAAGSSLIAALQENWNIRDVKTEACGLPPADLEEMERILEANRRKVASAEARRQRKARAGFDRVVGEAAASAKVSLAAQHRDGARRVVSEEQVARAACRTLADAAVARIRRNALRASKRLRQMELMHNLRVSQQGGRVQIIAEEEYELRLIAELEEYAERRVKQRQVDAEIQILKRDELVSWSSARRSEKSRREAERLAREGLEAEAVGKKMKVSEEDYAVALQQLLLLEVRERGEAAEREQERKDREAREAWLKEREAKEALEREIWTKKQQELEKDLRVAQQEKRREAIVQDESRLRESCSQDQDLYRDFIFAVQKTDCQAIQALVLLIKLERERSALVELPPSVEFEIEPSVNKPRTAYIGDCLPIQCVACPRLTLSLPDDFVSKLATLDKQIQLALKSLNEAHETANRENAKLRARNEGVLAVVLSRFLATGSPTDAVAALSDAVVTPASPHSPQAALRTLLPLPEEVCSAVAAAVALACCAAPPLPTSAKKKGKLRDTIRQARLHGTQRGVLQVYPENMTYRDVPPHMVAAEKLRIRGGHLKVSVTGAVPAERFSCDTHWVTTAPLVDTKVAGGSDHHHPAAPRRRRSTRFSSGAYMPSDAGETAQRRSSSIVSDAESRRSSEVRRRSMSAVFSEKARDPGAGVSDVAVYFPACPVGADAAVLQHLAMERAARCMVSGSRTKGTRPAPEGTASVGVKATAATLIRSARAVAVRELDVAELGDDPPAAPEIAVGIPLDEQSDKQQKDPEQCLPSDITDLVTRVRYRFDTDIGNEGSVEIPAQRDIHFRLTLHFSGSASRATIAVERLAGVAVIVVRPLIMLQGENTIEYIEDTPPDACRFMNIRLSDPIAPLFTDQGYKITALSFHNYVLRCSFTEGYTLDDVLLYSYSEGVFLRQGDRKDLVQAALDYPPAMAPPFHEEDASSDEPLMIWLEDRDACDRAVPIGEVILGSLFAVGRPPYKTTVSTPEVKIRWHSSLATMENVRKALKRLRFGNFSQDPTPGDRVLQVGMVDVNQDECRCEVIITIIAEDDAATMQLMTSKAHYRHLTSATHPPNYRQYLSIGLAQPFIGIKVEDVDTDRFVGGYIEACIATGAQRGDLLFLASPVCDSFEESQRLFLANPQGVNVIRQAREDSSEPGYDIMFEGRLVATVVKGMVMDPSDPREEFERRSAAMLADGEDHFGISIVFSEKGAASIRICAPIIECIAWSSTHLRPKEVERGIDLCLQPGASYNEGAKETIESLLEKELDPPLQERLSLRVCSEFFEVSQTSMSYREGSGPVRLAPFELTSDTSVDFTGGVITAQIVKGYISSDVLGMRESAEYKMALRDDGNPLDRGASFCIQPEGGGGGSGGAGGGDAPADIRPSSADDAGQAEGNPQQQGDAGQGGGAEPTPASSPRHRGFGLFAAAGADGGGAPPPEGDSGGAGTASLISTSARPQRRSFLQAIAAATAAAGTGGGGGGGGGATAPAPQVGNAMNLSTAQTIANAFSGASKMSKIRQKIGKPPNLLKKAGLGTIKDMVSATQRQRMVEERLEKGQVVVFDVYSSLQHLGVLTVVPGGLTFHFTARSVKRRDVINVMRSITYSNISSSVDADALVKYIRISASDSSGGRSESIIHVEIQEVDDVTDFIMAKPRQTYRIGAQELESMTGVFPVAPIGKSWLYDPDTQWFTGGNLAVELVAGHTKHDFLRFMSVDEQRRYREGAVAESNCIETDLSQYPYLDVRGDGEIYDVDTDVTVGALSFPKVPSWAPSNNIKIEFTKQEQVVSLMMAGYCLNCIAYTTHLTDKSIAPNAQKMYHLSIDDGVNPEVGKSRVKIDVFGPILYISSADLRSPFSYIDEVVVASSVAVICPKTIVNWVGGDKKGNSRDSVLTGHITCTVHQGKQDGDAFFLKKDFSQALGKNIVVGERLHIEFTPTTKLKSKQIQDLVRNIALRAPNDGPRVVKVHLADSVGMPQEIYVAVKGKPPG